MIVIGDFNARCKNWWAADVNANADKELDSLISTAGYTQLIYKPTHFFSGASSCINLIFCNKLKIVSESGIDHSLFQTCHHNPIFAKISANLSLPTNYSRKREKAFKILSINEKLGILNNTLLNIFRNNIPNKIVKCGYRDLP